MTTNLSEKTFLVITTVLILIAGNIVLTSAQSETPTISLKIGFSPSQIEQIEAKHGIGYVWLENKAGNPITNSNDVTINLDSSNPQIVSVDDVITISPELRNFSQKSANDKMQAEIDRLKFEIERLKTVQAV
jgi:hypothetical protein